MRSAVPWHVASYEDTCTPCRVGVSRAQALANGVRFSMARPFCVNRPGSSSKMWVGRSHRMPKVPPYRRDHRVQTDVLVGGATIPSHQDRRGPMRIEGQNKQCPRLFGNTSEWNIRTLGKGYSCVLPSVARRNLDEWNTDYTSSWPGSEVR